jgi:DNA polymerase sigma
MILGKMLEVYVRGALSAYNEKTILTSVKLKHTDMSEVDICDPKRRILCEVTSGRTDKKLNKIHVDEYYKDIPSIRRITL